jgi:hypothetical protein
MTGPTEFSHEDSSAVVAAPLFAAMAVISAGAPRVAVREIAASGRTHWASPSTRWPRRERCSALLHPSSEPEALSAAYGLRPAFWPQGPVRSEASVTPAFE